MKGLATMYDHKWKKWGFIISALGLMAMLAERIYPFTFIKKFNAEQHYNIFQWFVLFGLVVVIYSKEKYDDERAKAIRLRAFQIAFALQQAVLLAMALTGSTTKEKMGIEAPDLFVFAAIGIILYVLVFHVGLYFDFLWEYEDQNVWENLKNIKKNKWGIIVYLVLSAILLLSLTLFGTK